MNDYELLSEIARISAGDLSAWLRRVPESRWPEGLAYTWRGLRIQFRLEKVALSPVASAWQRSALVTGPEGETLGTAVRRGDAWGFVPARREPEPKPEPAKSRGGKREGAGRPALVSDAVPVEFTAPGALVAQLDSYCEQERDSSGKPLSRAEGLRRALASFLAVTSHHEGSTLP